MMDLSDRVLASYGRSGVPKQGWELHLTEEELVEILDNYRGNGGKMSLYALTKKFKLPANALYSILSQPRVVLLRKARFNQVLC